ncbi:unnamed protein product [Cuscuta epithymum]|uniref:RNase H type-1 domain-containing protein n=1 Tax=Cuscuta epithymum TaxID=186058 RepID=A0AAV0FGM9_9ASTE|nr:unnamed protein product [Cuscuta epithymum]
MSFLHWLEGFFFTRKAELETVVWGCWGLWAERNARIWQQTMLSAPQVMRKSRCYVEGWLQAQKLGNSGDIRREEGVVLCRLPSSGWQKLNIDAARNQNGSGYGWVLRNDHGEFVGEGQNPV